MKKRYKFLLKTFLGICLFLGSVYLGLVAYYENVFSVLTYINGIYSTGKTVEAVNMELNNSNEYKGVLISLKDNYFYLDANSIDYSIDYSEELNNCLSKQNSYYWVVNVWKGKNEYNLKPTVSFDENKLKELLQNQVDFHTGTTGYKVSLELTDKGFTLNDTKKDILDFSKAFEVIKKALINGEENIDLVQNNCYYNEGYTEYEEELIEFYSLLEAYQNRAITYLFDDEKEVFTPADIVRTLSFYNAYQKKDYTEKDFMKKYIDDNGNLVVDLDNVLLLLDEKLEPYNTYQNHTFTTHDGRVLKIPGGTYGNKIDMQTELEKIAAFLQGPGGVYTRTPEYLKEALYKGKNDIGNTYVEVDILKQKMFYFRDGELFLETDVVTGKNNATKEEVCYVYGKQKNRVLRGPGYETFVNYWMPVSGGIGIHDASWRNEFGGDIYLTNGSHGCINTPFEIVKEMYEVMEIGTPCIIYYGMDFDY